MSDWSESEVVAPLDSNCFGVKQPDRIRKLIVQTTVARLAPVLKTIFINVSYILVASLTLMALFNRATRVRLATSIWYDTLMKNCFKDWSQSRQWPITLVMVMAVISLCKKKILEDMFVCSTLEKSVADPKGVQGGSPPRRNNLVSLGYLRKMR